MTPEEHETDEEHEEADGVLSWLFRFRAFRGFVTFVVRGFRGLCLSWGASYSTSACITAFSKSRVSTGTGS